MEETSQAVEEEKPKPLGGRSSRGTDAEPLQRACIECKLEKDKPSFSKSQWSRSERRCMKCLEQLNRHRPTQSGAPPKASIERQQRRPSAKAAIKHETPEIGGTEECVKAAVAVMDNACCKHSNYHVGACLMGGTEDSTLYTGVNVESDSYGLTCCAERVALFKALTAGERNFLFMAVATADGGISCGACRQLLSEYCPPTMQIKFVDSAGVTIRSTTVAQLMPDPFVLKN